MNKNQVQGTLKDVAGQVQEKSAHLVGNPKQELKGLKKQAEGKTQKAVGDLQEIIKDASRK